MTDASKGSVVLEVQEPRLAARRFDPASLMRAVHHGPALAQDDAVFIRAEDALRAQHSLPTCLDAAGRGKHVVVSVAFVHLRAFHRGMVGVAIEDDLALVEQPGRVWLHAVQAEHAVDPCPALGERVHEVGVAIIVPERAGVDPALGLLDEDRLRPRPAGIRCLRHEDAFVRRAHDDQEAALMEA